MMTVAKEMGYTPLFIGAYRDAGLPQRDSWEGFEVVRVGKYFQLLNGKQFGKYFFSTFRFWIGVWAQLRLSRPGIIHASDFEAWVPCAIYSRIFKVGLVYNIHDNLAIRHRLPWGIAKLLNAFEGIAVIASTITVVPEVFRSELLPSWCRSKVRVLRNSPVDPGPKSITVDDGLPRVIFAGWLDQGRGLDSLLRLADSGSIELMVAGEGDRVLLNRARSTRGVTYLGFISHQEVMKATQDCHLVAAYYDPSRPINRYAASNKVAEALALGRPVLINSEMLVSEKLKKSGCAIVCAYSEIEEQGRRIAENFEGDADVYFEMCRAARALYEKEYDWKVLKAMSIDVFEFARRRL